MKSIQFTCYENKTIMLTDISNDMLSYILQYCPIAQIGRLCRLNKQFYHECTKKKYYERQLSLEFPYYYQNVCVRGCQIGKQWKDMSDWDVYHHYIFLKNANIEDLFWEIIQKAEGDCLIAKHYVSVYFKDIMIELSAEYCSIFDALYFQFKLVHGYEEDEEECISDCAIDGLCSFIISQGKAEWEYYCKHPYDAQHWIYIETWEDVFSF